VIDVLEFLGDPSKDFPADLITRVERLLEIVRPLVVSGEPDVVLSSLARLCVPAFSDGCSLELHTPTVPVYRIRYPRGRTHRLRDAVRTVNRFDDDDRFSAVVRVAIASPPGAFGPRYDGEMVYAWREYQPGRGDQGLADLLVDRAQRIIERQRVLDALAAAEDLTERMRRAAGAGREIEAALDKLRLTHLSDDAGYEMLRRAGEEAELLLTELALQSDFPDHLWPTGSGHIG
jgi:hypothetical protein